jgi:hypothetical protein
MRQLLKLHQESRCAAVTRIEADVTRQRPDTLQLNFFASGVISDLRIPARKTPARAEELWRHTCFEAFVRPAQSSAYYEFNFAPSLHWAAYRFDTYRTGMHIAGEARDPKFEVRSSDSGYEMQVSLELSRFADLRDGALLRINLAAVIEETGGRISYWAVAHAPGKADFHQADCFTLELPAA